MSDSLAAEVACVPIGGFQRGKIKSVGPVDIGRKIVHINLKGENFGRPGSLRVDGRTVPHAFWSDERVNATLPPDYIEKPGKYKVMTENRQGKSNIFTFLVEDSRPKINADSVHFDNDKLVIKGNFGSRRGTIHLKGLNGSTENIPDAGNWFLKNNKVLWIEEFLPKNQRGYWHFQPKGREPRGQWLWRTSQPKRLNQAGHWNNTNNLIQWSNKSTGPKGSWKWVPDSDNRTNGKWQWIPDDNTNVEEWNEDHVIVSFHTLPSSGQHELGKFSFD